jgi:hypothetical protein
MDQTSLQYTCKCSNGTDISSAMSDYQQTVPAQMCRFWYDACINASGTSASAQRGCIEARDTRCGNLTTDSSDNSDSSSSSPSSSATSARASGSSTPTGSAGAAASSTQPAAAANVAAYGMPVLAGGLLAVFGLAL